MTRVPIRLLFLGNRRIAWEVLKLLLSDSYRSSFDVRAIVTDASIWHQCQAIHPQLDATFISSERRHSGQISEIIKTQSIKVLLSIQYNWIIPSETLDLVSRRAFNLHNARLPDYKGYNSISHAIANRDNSYDTTLHWMADEVDSGDLAYVTHTPIRADDTAVSLYVRTVDAAITTVKRLLYDLASGADPPRMPITRGYGTFYARNSVESLANVTENINPEHLARIARATFFPPNNTAYFLHEGRKYLVLPDDELARFLMLGTAANNPII